MREQMAALRKVANEEALSLKYSHLHLNLCWRQSGPYGASTTVSMPPGLMIGAKLSNSCVSG
jgi:hypothetical protein